MKNKIVSRKRSSRTIDLTSSAKKKKLDLTNESVRCPSRKCDSPEAIQEKTEEKVAILIRKLFDNIFYNVNSFPVMFRLISKMLVQPKNDYTIVNIMIF